MLNLSELVFKVNTEALVDAANKVAALGKSVDGLSSTFSKLEKSSSQASKAQAKAEKDLAAAEVDRAKAADIAAKTEERKSKAVRDTAKATEEATAATKKSVSILERQRDINAFVAQGFTQGQASTMASAKAAGALADELRELGAVMKNTRSLIGGNPFDKSLNGLEALRNEYQVLTRVQTMMVQGLNLTQKQMKELAMDEIRLTAAMKAQGKSAQETSTAIAKLNRDYLTTAGNVNAVVRAEQELANMQREAASANAFLEKEMQRVNFALQAQNNELNKGTANALNRFEQNLKRSGLTLDQQRVKMEEYRKGLLALEKTKGGNTDYITRALGPQITDIFVGLATGQSPLTVMLQQGGQLRDQFALAGVAADEMGAKMRTAAKDMVVSVAAVARAFGDLLIGAFIDAGKGVVNFVSQIALVDKVTEGAKRRLAAMGDEGFAYIGKLEKFAGVIAAGIGITLAATIAAVVALGVALKQVTTEQNELAKSLNLTGAALGMSSKEVVAFAQGLDSVKTSAAIEFINELSKAGVRTSKDIAGLTEVAIDLEKYGGVALKETAKAYDDLQKKPFEALMKIAEGTGQVSQKTIDMAVEMKLAGDEVGLLNLAQKEFVRANKAAVESIKAEINPMTALWITIKDGITFAWEGLKNFARTGVVLEGVVKVLNTILTGVLAITTATRFAGKTLGGYLAIMGQVADGINPFSGVSASEALKNIQGIFSEYKADIKNLGSETSAAYDQIWNGVKTTTGLTDKARESNSAYATDTVKGMQDLERAYNSIEKAELKKITRQAAINKALEDYKQKNKQASDLQLKIIEQGAGLAWDKANKERSKKDPKENYFATLMRDATNATIKADGAVQDLTKSEIKLREVQADPRFKALSKDEQDRITRIYETAAATERVTAAEDLKNKLLGKATGLGKEYYDTLEIIENYHERGIYSDAEVKQLTDALYKATPAYKENVKAVEELNNKLFKFREESLAIRQQLDEENRGLDLRVALLGKTEREQVVISREYERQAKLAKVSFNLEKRKRDIEKEWAGNAVKIWELELAAEQDAAEQRKVINRGVAVAYAEDIQKEFDRISGGITDSIVTALFEGGKAGSKKLRDLIMSELRKPVTIVVQAVVNTVLGSVIGGLTGSSGGGGLLGSVATSLGGNAVTQGLGLSGLTSGITTAISAGFKGATLAPGLMGPTTAGAGGFMGLGNAMASIPGWGWAIAGIATLAGLMSKKATPHTGGAALANAAGVTGLDIKEANIGFASNKDATVQKSVEDLAKLVQSTVTTVAGLAGITSKFSVATGFADDTSKDGAWGQLVIKRVDGTVEQALVDWENSRTTKWAPKVFADGEAGYKEYLNAIATDTKNVLQDMDLPKWMQKLLGTLNEVTDADSLNKVLQLISDYPNLLLQKFGTSRDALVSKFVEGLQAGDAKKAGQDVADMFVQSIETAMVTNASAAIFDIVNTQIITPIMDSLMAGATISEALASASIDKAIEAAKKQAEAFSLIWNDPSFKQAIEGIRTGLGGIFGNVAEGLNYTPKYVESIKDTTDATSAAADAEQERQKAIQDALNLEKSRLGLLKSIYTLEEDDIRLKETINALRKIELSEMDKSLQGLQEQLWMLEDTNAETQKRVALQKSELQLHAQIYSLLGDTVGARQVELALREMELKGLDKSLHVYQQQIWAIEDYNKAQEKSKEGIKSLKDTVDTIFGFAQSDTDKAFAALERAVEAERKEADKAVESNTKLADSIKEVFDLLTDKVRELYRSVDSTQRMQAQQGRELIKQALATGVIPDAKKLGEAIDSVTEGLDKTIYKSQFEADRDRLVFAAELSNLKDTSEDQLTEAEKALEAAKKQVEYLDTIISDARKQIDIMRGVDVSVISVKDAVDRLALAILNEKKLGAVKDNVLIQGKYSDAAAYNVASKEGTTATGSLFTASAAMNAAVSHLGLGTPEAAFDVYKVLANSGYSLAQAEDIFGLPAGSLAEQVDALSATMGVQLPKFADGGMYQGGLALVGEKGPELINFSNSGQVHTAGQTADLLRNNNAELVNEIKALREDNKAQALAIVQLQSRVAKVIERWDGDGLPEVRAL